MGLVRSFIGTDGIWQYIPHINTGLFSIIKVHFLLFANLIVDWHINTINFTDSGLCKINARGYCRKHLKPGVPCATFWGKMAYRCNGDEIWSQWEGIPERHSGLGR